MNGAARRISSRFPILRPEGVQKYDEGDGLGERCRKATAASIGQLNTLRLTLRPMGLVVYEQPGKLCQMPPAVFVTHMGRVCFSRHGRAKNAYL